MRNERSWPQQCWKSCANGSNVVALRSGDHGTKEMLGVVGWTTMLCPFARSLSVYQAMPSLFKAIWFIIFTFFIVWYEAVNLSFSGKILAITSSPVQTGATLLDVTCCVRLHTLLRVVGCCCAKFETGQTFQPTTPNLSFVPWSPKRSATINVGSVCTALPTLLEPRTLITHGLQRLMGCILPTMHCGSQHCWELLHPFTYIYTRFAPAAGLISTGVLIKNRKKIK